MVYLLLVICLFPVVILLSLSSADRSLLLGKSQRFDFQGTQRHFRVFVPEKMGPNPKMIFVFHGYSGSSRQMAYFSALHNSTDENTIVVYPDASKPSEKGTKTGWNAGFCCGSGYVQNIDDVGFIRELSINLANKYSVEKDRIYAVGFSNGGMFVNRLASEAPSEFGGFASVSGSIGTVKKKLEPKTAVPILLLHGEKDTTVPFNGGPGSTDSSYKWLSFQDTKHAWELANHAENARIETVNNAVVTSYGKEKQPVRTITYKKLTHRWPDWRLANFWHKKSSGSQEIITFFNSL